MTMTHPAELTHRLDWADLILALRAEIRLIDRLVHRLRAGGGNRRPQQPDLADEYDLASDRDLRRHAEALDALEQHRPASPDDRDHHPDPDPDLEIP